jgi:uncharacterized RDD family membrane protein YckC
VTTGNIAGQASTGLARRLAAMLYEGLLLFGVVMLAGLLYSILTQQRHALQGRLGMQAFLFVVLAVYFVWFWTHGGQTVAMKTWRLRVITVDGTPLTRWRALARYVLAWLWFLPSLLAVYLSGLSGGVVVSVVLLAGMAAYAALTRLHPDRQFLHDVICGTRLVDTPPPPPPPPRKR